MSRSRLALRLLIYLLLAAIGLGWYSWRTWWTPEHSVETSHFRIATTDRREVASAAGQVLERCFEAYKSTFSLSQAPVAQMQVRIYASREEMHAVNVRVPDWAEGFYVNKVSHQYISSNAAFRWDSLIHESVHQLNSEYAGLDLPKWVEEGLACVFAVAADQRGSIEMGRMNPDAYPVRHLRELPLSGDLEKDINNQVIIPVQDVLAGKTPLPVDDYFNRYYVHWFTLVHYFMNADNGKRRQQFVSFVLDGADSDTFELQFGALNDVNEKWYAYLLSLHARLNKRIPELPLK